jgi:hypothetical protein
LISELVAHRVAAVVVIRRAANFDVVLYLLAVGIVLRDADCFFAILRAVRGSAQFNVALRVGAHGHAREVRVLLQSRLNLAGRVAAHIALRNAGRGAGRSCAGLSTGAAGRILALVSRGRAGR